MTELLAIMLSNSLIVTAADELRDDLPGAATIELTVGERKWECRFACDDAAMTTRPALRAQGEEQARKVCAQIQKDADRRQGKLRWLRKWGCPGGLATAAGLGGATFIPAAPPELMIPAFIVAVPSILGLSRLPKAVRRATDQTEQEKRVVTGQINEAACQLADLWDADRRSAGIHLPDLRGYCSACPRTVSSRPPGPWRPSRSREHASSRIGLPARPSCTPRSRPTTCGHARPLTPR